MLHRLATLVVLFAAGCVVGEDSLGDAGPDRGTTSVVAQLSDTGTIERGPEMQENVCDLLPMDGPCSLACDPDALVEEYVPVGTCIVFLCTLTDGRFLGLHACHAGD